MKSNPRIGNGQATVLFSRLMLVTCNPNIHIRFIGQWDLVNYDGKQYPGEITQITNYKTDIEINVIHRSGSKF